MALLNAVAVFWTSLLALPLSYVLNTVAFYGKDQRLIFLAGACCLSLIYIIPQIILKRTKPPKIDSFYHVMSLLTYSSITSLIVALENDGLIAEFLGYYLRDGLPFMKTAYGTVSSYWDGIAHSAIYMMMMAAITWNQAFYDVGLYWVGSFGHRLLVLNIAVAMGRTWSDVLSWVFVMQIPFIAIFIWAGWKFMMEKTEEGIEAQEEIANNSEARNKICLPIWKRPTSLLLLMFYGFAGCFTFFRFMGAMESKTSSAQHYSQKIEPYLRDPLPFSKAEILVQTFYFIPYYGLSIFALLVPGQSWVPQWSLIFAGAAGQGQFAYMGSSLHYRTPYIYRVPQMHFARALFWLCNSTLFIVPQVAAYMYNMEPDYFLIKPVQNKVDASQTSNGSAPDNMINRKNE